MRELDIIKSMLATMGERAPTSVDSLHPSVVEAREVLARVNDAEQSIGWYFNTERNRLFQVNMAGEVLVPENTLSVVCIDDPARYVVRGRVLYDMQNFTTVIGRDVRADRVARIEYEYLPPVAAEYIRACAVYEYFVQGDGEGNKHVATLAARDKAWANLRRLHIHWQQSNMNNSPMVSAAVRPSFGGLYPNGSIRS